MSGRSSLEDEIWRLTDLNRPVRVAEARELVKALRRVVEAEVDSARQEGWQDGYFEAGGLNE